MFVDPWQTAQIAKVIGGKLVKKENILSSTECIFNYSTVFIYSSDLVRVLDLITVVAFVHKLVKETSCLW